MKRVSKYGAKACVIDGVRFASLKEGRRYEQLKLLVRAGQISGLELQPRFPLVVNGLKVCTYVGDFSYQEAGARVIEDSKGVLTDVFKLKRKLMKAVHGIEILLT